MRPLLLDAFCGGGGAGMGYYRAGFDVIGVDIKPQPRYPFEFIQADAVEFIKRYGGYFDAIHASPPCQTHSALARMYSDDEIYQAVHVDLIPQTRVVVRAAGRPYVIENVVGAPLEYPAMLCGSMFNLKVYRHRLFETLPWMLSPIHVPHRDNTPAVGRGMSKKGFISITGTGGFGIPNGWNYACRAIGIDWMSREELSQAIPPAYTEYIGRRLVEYLDRVREAAAAD